MHKSRLHFVFRSVLSIFLFFFVQVSAQTEQYKTYNPWENERVVHQLNNEVSGEEETTKNSRGVTVAYQEGSGLYRDPLEVLGSKFPAAVMADLCAVNLLLYADAVSDVKFIAKGTKLCADVCGQYQRNIVTDGTVDVDLMRGYCDYTGSVCRMGDDECHLPSLSTTCTCAYKVRCNHRTNMIMYEFEANEMGFLKVSVAESKPTRNITR